MESAPYDDLVKEFAEDAKMTAGEIAVIGSNMNLPEKTRPLDLSGKLTFTVLYNLTSHI
jgi:hypothetical protein